MGKRGTLPTTLASLSESTSPMENCFKNCEYFFFFRKEEQYQLVKIPLQPSVGRLHMMGIPHQIERRMAMRAGLRLRKEDEAQEKNTDSILKLDVLRTPFLALGVGVTS